MQRLKLKTYSKNCLLMKLLDETMIIILKFKILKLIASNQKGKVSAISKNWVRKDNMRK
jgi:hypothetical protein